MRNSNQKAGVRQIMATKTMTPTTAQAPTRTTWAAACERFTAAMVQCAAEFAATYVAHIDAGFKPAELQEAAPTVSPFTWARLHDIGRGLLIPELLMYLGPQAVLRLSLSEQRRTFNEGIDVVERAHGSGDVTMRTIPLYELAAQQARIAITGGTVATKAKQARTLARLEAEAERRQTQVLEAKRNTFIQVMDDGTLRVHTGHGNHVTVSKEDAFSLFSTWKSKVF